MADAAEELRRIAAAMDASGERIARSVGEAIAFARTYVVEAKRLGATYDEAADALRRILAALFNQTIQDAGAVLFAWVWYGEPVKEAAR